MNTIKIFYMAVAKENIAIYGVVSNIRENIYSDKKLLVNTRPKKRMLRKVFIKYLSKCQG